MAKKAQRIVLGKGLDDLPFGATQEQVEAVLGKPEETDELDLKGEKSIAWHFWELGISVNFDESQDFRLSSIDVASPEVLLFDEPLIGKTEAEVKAFLADKKIGEPEPEVQRGLNYNDANLSLWFNGGELEEIQWGIIEWIINHTEEALV